MRRTIIFCILMLSLHISDAQNNISGKITDSKNNPIEGANIYLSEINKGMISKSDGTFVVDNLPNGKIRIQFSHLGYKSFIETVDLKNNSNINLDIVLMESAIEMEEIVVTGGYNSTQHENTVKIDILKLDPERKLITPTFAQVLTKVPGVDIISKGNGVAKPVIRGLSMNDILILNNGVRFENYQYSNHHPLGIDEFGIIDIEILKGPASLMYGSDAIGGVINFIKEKPAPINTLEGDYNLQLFSNSLGVTNNLGLKASGKKWYGGFRVGQKTNADYLQGGGKFVPNSRFDEWVVQTNIGYTDKIGTFSLFYDNNREKLGLVEPEAIQEINQRGRSLEIYYQRFNTQLISSKNKLYLGKLKLDINTAYQNTELVHFGEIGIYEIQMQLKTLTYDTKLYLPSNRYSEYIIGVQGNNQWNTNLNNRETILLPDAGINNYSFFGLFQRTFFNKLRLQTGIRYDYKNLRTSTVGNITDLQTYRPALNKNYGSFSGSLGTTYNLSEELLFRANVASAYRTPNLAELTSNGQHEERYEIGYQKLLPEKSYEADLSAHFHKEDFTFDIACFYNLVNHFIYISPTGEETSAGLAIYRYGQTNSYLYGGETGIHFHPFSMKWLHIESTFSSVIGKQKTGNYLPFVPANKFRFEMKGEKEKLLCFYKAYALMNLTTAFNQNHAAPDEKTTVGYTLIDLSIGGNVKLTNKMVFISLNVSNILDKTYIDHLSTLKEVNLFNQGRNISLNLKIPFGCQLKY